MVQIKDITQMCKEGKISEAYAIVKKELDNDPHDLWTQRAMGWVVYYTAKERIFKKKASRAMDAIQVLRKLNMLTPQGDGILFDNILWEIRSLVEVTKKGDDCMMESVLDFISSYTFVPSKAYSALLKTVKPHDWWERLTEFYDQWNFDNLMPRDYQSFKTESGKSVMSLAEQVYISYAKAAISQRDEERIKAFIPKIEKLAKEHPEMTYPGYFCGKLLMAQGGDKEETLAMVTPFVVKKKNEFWAWQLMSEVFHDEPDIRLACLLRAVHCKCGEEFLTQIRTLLALQYKNKNDYSRSHYQLQKIAECCTKEKRHPSYEVQCMMREPLIMKAVPDGSASLDYKKLTDDILLRDARTSMAVVTYRDQKKKFVILVYGQRKSVKVRHNALNANAGPGALLRIKWFPSGSKDGGMDICSAEKVQRSELQDAQSTYVREVRGTFLHRQEWAYAFVKTRGKAYFVPPVIARESGAVNGETVTALAVYNYTPHKDKWDWQCLSVEKGDL